MYGQIKSTNTEHTTGIQLKKEYQEPGNERVCSGNVPAPFVAPVVLHIIKF